MGKRQSSRKKGGRTWVCPPIGKDDNSTVMGPGEGQHHHQVPPLVAGSNVVHLAWGRGNGKHQLSTCTTSPDTSKPLVHHNTHTHTHTCIYKHKHTHMHIQTHIHTPRNTLKQYTSRHTHTHTHTHNTHTHNTHTHTHTHKNKHTLTHTQTYAQKTYMYTHTSYQETIVQVSWKHRKSPQV